MKVVRVIAGEFGSNCWLVIDEETGQAVLIDPSPTVDKIKDALETRGASLKYILLTHGHFDHMTSCDTLRELTGAPLCVHSDDAECVVNSELNAYRMFMAGDMVFRPADIILKDGDTLDFGKLTLKVIHTPGHTAGSACYIIGDSIFTGDTLFDGGIGRCDLPGSVPEKMTGSLIKLRNISGDYKMYTGHGSNTTLDKQRLFNVYLKNAEKLDY